MIFVVIYSTFQHLMNCYFYFSDQSDHRHSEPEKENVQHSVFRVTCFTSEKKTFWILQKKAKSQTEKTPNCHKTKTRMKEKKKSSKQRLTPHTPHTRLKLHYIHTLIHQNFIHKYHPCHQINQSTKLPILDFYSSLIAVPQHQTSMLIYLPIKVCIIILSA